MTKQALQDLRDKVAAGGDDLPAYYASRAFPNGYCHAVNAYNGSLDAAMALHNAVLPGCSQYSIVTDPTCLKVSVCWWPDGLSGKREVHGEGWSEADPARAWLLSILDALISEQPTHKGDR